MDGLGCPVAAALAYLDPGTGSIMLQVLLGVLLGAGFMIKVFWRRLAGLCGRLLVRRGQKDGQVDD